MAQRSDKLAHEAEQIRKELAATIEELRYRTSRAYFVDQLAGLARGVGSQIGSDLRHNLRKNPLPFTLLGAGAALLALKPQWARTGAREPAGAPGPQMTPGEPGSPLASSRKTKAEQTARPTRQTLTSAASKVSSALGDVAKTAKRHPLVSTGAALAAGAALGALLPARGARRAKARGPASPGPRAWEGVAKAGQ